MSVLRPSNLLVGVVHWVGFLFLTMEEGVNHEMKRKNERHMFSLVSFPQTPWLFIVHLQVKELLNTAQCTVVLPKQ